MKCFKKILFAFICFLLISKYKGATCVALASNSWNVATNWSCGSVPTCGDSIVIPVGITLSITTQQDYSTCILPLKLTIYGTLFFKAGNKLKLPCGSKIYLMIGGNVVSGGGGGNSNNIEICNTVYWNTASGPITGLCSMPPGGCAAAIVLPIELITFKVENMSTMVAVNWATATEKNTNYFLVERSDDAYNWATVSKVKAAENSTSILHYEIFDESPLNGISYYRLKTVDLDLSLGYSQIQLIERSKKEPFVIFYPNPSNSILNIVSSYNSADVKFELLNITGGLIKADIIEVNENKIVLDVSTLARGIYFLNISAPNGNHFKANKIILK